LGRFFNISPLFWGIFLHADLGAPHELVADGGEEILRADADELDGEGGAGELDGGVTLQGVAVGVDAEGEF
jgi:hypothetical protein